MRKKGTPIWLQIILYTVSLFGIIFFIRLTWGNWIVLTLAAMMFGLFGFLYWLSRQQQ